MAEKAGASSRIPQDRADGYFGVRRLAAAWQRGKGKKPSLEAAIFAS
jgi:hypothetical protein